MGQKNSACESSLAVKSGVVKPGKIIIVKTSKNLGPRCPGCYIQNAVKLGADKAVVHCIFKVSTV